MCGVTCLPSRDGHAWRAAGRCLVRRSATASRLRWPPARLGNSGSPWPAFRSVIHVRSSLAVGLVSGVQRCLRPLSQRCHKGRYLDVSVMPMMHVQGWLARQFPVAGLA